MAHQHALLLIDDDASSARDRCLLMDFIGETYALGESNNWQDCLGPIGGLETVRATIIGRVAASRLPALISNVLEQDPGMPIITIGDHDVSGLSDISRRSCIGKIDEKGGYNQWVQATHRAQIYREHLVRSAQGERREVHLFRSLVGTSRAISDVREMMGRVADSEATVLVLGESGTGKEVVARNLHYNSNRKDKPFVPVNCGAIPAELLESELFGHEKGAFTGAFSARTGRFELAQGGTLFLDEIGDMPLNMQVKLLRVLQERTFERVGGNKIIEADVRIIAATHRNLEDMVAEGKFREDLFYRLNVFPIEMPALRERTEDIPLLLQDLMRRLETEGRGSIKFNSSALMSISHHPWPGNVRELANLVERLAIMHPYGVIGLKELPTKFRYIEEPDEEEQAIIEAAEQQSVVASATANPSSGGHQLPMGGIDLKNYLAEIEKSLIEQALNEAQGIVARAAERLKLRRTTLVEKMRKYELSSEK